MTGAYALGLALSAGMSMLFGRWVDRYGPRLLMTAGSCAATVATMERSISTRTALHGASFWLLTAAFALNTLGASAMLIHLVPYLTDHGDSAATAATVTGLVGVMALPGRLVLTPLGDRVPRAAVACGIFLLQAAALLALLLVPGTAGVALFVLLFGAGFGAVTPARAALVADYYGPRAYGAISGVVAFFLTGARAAGPVLAGVLYDLTGGYHLAFWGVTVTSLVAAAAVVLADRQARRVRDASPRVPDHGVAPAG